MDLPASVLGPSAILLFFVGVFIFGHFRNARLEAKRRESGQLSDAQAFQMRGRMRRLERPTLLLIPTTSPGSSKVGGLPDLPLGVVWPKGEGEALAFVAQIDIETFRKHGAFDWLPERGRLYLFFDDDRNGAADCGTLIYTNDPPGPERVAPPDLARSRRFLERRVGFRQFASFPSPDWFDEDWPGHNMDWSGFRGLEDCDFGDEIEHRIGGYPGAIQDGQMQIECEYLWRGQTRDYRDDVPETIRVAARQWRLLLQIDSDPALNMNWWDGGRLYVFIRARDAKRGDFSKIVTITQTH
jgi:uncharacterized protein YwqG